MRGHMCPRYVRGMAYALADTRACARGCQGILQRSSYFQTGWPAAFLMSFFHMAVTIFTTASGIGT
jgi:hypothetical protein